jgi:hypothetical protein
MAGIKISALPAIPSSALTDVAPFVQSGVTYQASLTQIATLFNAQLTFLPIAGGTLTGALNLGGFQINNLAAPTLATDAANKSYVDTIATGGGAPVVAASTGALTVTQAGAGVGATLTNAGSQATFALDGQSPTVGQRVLIKNQSTNTQNGVYTVTNVGSNSTNWILTRATDYDTPADINGTGTIPVSAGTANANTGWINTTLMVTVDTTAITFVSSFVSLPVAIANGGTSVTSVTVAPAATAFAGWDANKNLSANNFLAGYATTATAAGTTTLVVGSAQQQYFTGVTTQTVVLPVTSTLVLGQSFLVVNNSTGVVTVQSSGANNISVLPANTSALFTCIAITGTTAASWSFAYMFGLTPTGTGAPVLAISPSLTTPSITTGINDANSNAMIDFTATSSAVNYLQAINAATGNNPVFEAKGSDTNVSLLLKGQGTGGVGLLGYTDASSAAAGYVGQVISSAILFASAVSISNATAKDLTSITLTAGDWDVWGNIVFDAVVSMTSTYAWISTSSATLPDVSLYSGAAHAVGSVSISGVTVLPKTFTVSGNTTVYISGYCAISSSTADISGGIYARRRR